MSASSDPWKVRQDDYQDAWEARQAAIDRGLRAHNWTVFDAYEVDEARWPKWAQHAYFSFPASLEVLAVRVLAEGPAETREAVEAAYALGGSQAVNDLLWPAVRARREAQGDFTGGPNRPEETA